MTIGGEGVYVGRGGYHKKKVGSLVAMLTRKFCNLEKNYKKKKFAAGGQNIFHMAKLPSSQKSFKII